MLVGLRDLHADYLIESSCIPYERKIKLKMRVVITERKLLAVGLGNEQGQKRKLVRLIELSGENNYQFPPEISAKFIVCAAGTGSMYLI